MKSHRRVIRVSRERAIEIAAALNGITLEMAKSYTDSELKECLRLLKIKANF